MFTNNPHQTQHAADTHEKIFECITKVLLLKYRIIWKIKLMYVRLTRTIKHSNCSLIEVLLTQLRKKI